MSERWATTQEIAGRVWRLGLICGFVLGSAGGFILGWLVFA
jgi:hypothetical protein